MAPIPKKLREEMAADPYYGVCSRLGEDCSGRITWEHAFTYAGKQIQRKWAIIPLCWRHHLGDRLNKVANQHIAAARTTEEDRREFARINWIMYGF